MEFNQIKELIQLIDSSSLAFFEFSDGEDHIKMDKSLHRFSNDNSEPKETISDINKSLSATDINASKKVEQTEKVVKNQEVKDKADEQDENLKVITSPMVGTFYAKASPESNPFVSEGDVIQKGKVICIIEAMKLMNEIESDFCGTIVKCLVKDGDMVEYGQPLFKIREE
ncbi:MAG: acetyl-CoA carboxylase biotin carboxyl carrier protein [Clostridium butyricum]|nr:acetyl-CoA carboxylase biotin carboxyl carrier protein [Clostridium butyricum]